MVMLLRRPVAIQKVLGLALCLLMLALATGPASAQGSSIRDNFDRFHDGHWIKSNYDLGRSSLDPASVATRGGELRIRVPAGSLNGGEIESREFHGHGTYVARIKAPNAPSSITGFYLYRSPDYEAEIDIEIYNDGSRRVDYVTYADGKKTHLVSRKLPFDPRRGFHNYRIDYYPGVVKFYVDGRLVQRYRDGLPRGEMKLLVNTWFPSWLPGKAPARTTAARVDWIQLRPR